MLVSRRVVARRTTAMGSPPPPAAAARSWYRARARPMIRAPRATGARAAAMNERLVYFGCLRGTVADVIDAGVDVLPHFEMAAVTMLEGTERPGEWPQMRRR